MIILSLLNPFSDIMGILIWIVANVYHVAAWVFEVFLILSTGQLINREDYTLVIQNFYLVLGIIVLFYMTFSLLKGMVNPDDQKQGTSTVKSSIINLVTSTIIMALLPYIFGFMYDFQTAFITRYNVIGRFFGYGSLAEPTSANSVDYLCQMNNEEIKQGAFQIVNGIFTAFFNVNTDKMDCDVSDLSGVEDCQKSVSGLNKFLFISWRDNASLYDVIQKVNKDGFFSYYIDFTENVLEGEISFNFILSLLAGIALIYVGVSFCFDMALRMVKLVFYQIIAPIPIFSRVVPEGPFKGIFDKWVKVVLACYLEVFIRIFIFYFVVYLCMKMLASPYIGSILFCFNPIVFILARAMLLMGMVMFMKQAPKLISDITGIDSGNMKLGIKDKLRDGGFFAAASFIGAGATALTRNATGAIKNIKNKWGESTSIKDRAKLIAGGIGSTIAGGASGAFRGGKAGWKASSFADMKNAAGKGAKEAVDARGKRMEYKANHPNGVIRGRIDDFKDSVSRWAGFNNIQELKEENQMIDTISGKVDKVVDNSKEIIRSQLLAKGKSFGFGVSGKDNKYGISFDANTYRRISDLNDRAKNTGEAQDLSGIVSDKEILDHAFKKAAQIAASRGEQFREQDFHFEGEGPNTRILSDSEVIAKINAKYENATHYDADEIQRIFGKYESDYAKEVANSAFLSNENYEKYIYKTNADGSFVLDANGNRQRNITLEEEAAMTSARSAAVDARYELGRHIGSSLIQEANANITPTRNDGTSNIALDNNTINGDLKVTDGSTLDKLGATAKIIKAKNADEMAKIQQKEKDKKGEK